ncbi:MAG TPA: cation transport regulator ChaB [Kocuria sp.]|uniref:ChaB family protein n=1 Tax=Kocuria rhizophila TaxID=72000 RepID=UPI000E82F8F5|nr:ChaB family protein [Kocuria rhizophila]HAG63962.1 cation transport regulator ChaB [Kocuria sp.]MBK4120497.1 ChaB family protein [Kocuria rhizophila]MCC5673009.1 ChaB family protein [Kocuria rhizophila]MCC5674564.1 ChaB family protein [Kocuria rhizophila]WTI31964.1 ChaB family protein [Kocuria rhizophila]
MPKAKKNGRARQDEIPSTLRRSDEKAQDTFAQAYDSAQEEYQEESRAARTAWAAVKHTHEKVGGHWEPKEENGPSDASAEKGGLNKEDTAGGVDANASKEHLYEIAQELDVQGRSGMTKDELVEAIGKANDKRTREARD